ncbi:hypothetical protein CCP4SC76_3280001 [Gammaproteobacteria bacterium]
MGARVTAVAICRIQVTGGTVVSCRIQPLARRDKDGHPVAVIHHASSLAVLIVRHFARTTEALEYTLEAAQAEGTLEADQEEDTLEAAQAEDILEADQAEDALEAAQAEGTLEADQEEDILVAAQEDVLVAAQAEGTLEADQEEGTLVAAQEEDVLKDTKVNKTGSYWVLRTCRNPITSVNPHRDAGGKV